MGKKRVRTGETTNKIVAGVAHPRKRFYRARAHNNPFNDEQYVIPAGPHQVRLPTELMAASVVSARWRKTPMASLSKFQGDLGCGCLNYSHSMMFLPSRRCQHASTLGKQVKSCKAFYTKALKPIGWNHNSLEYFQLYLK